MAPAKIRKPSVAFTNEALARQNITAKLRELSALHSAGKAVGAPTSLRQFNAWTSEPGSKNQFKRNANETLAKHLDLKEEALTLFEASKAARQLSERPSRDEKVSRWKERCAVHRAIRLIAERQLVRLVDENRKLRARLEVTAEALKSTDEFLREETERLTAEVEAEREKSHQLCARLEKLRPRKVESKL